MGKLGFGYLQHLLWVKKPTKQTCRRNGLVENDAARIPTCLNQHIPGK